MAAGRATPATLCAWSQTGLTKALHGQGPPPDFSARDSGLENYDPRAPLLLYWSTFSDDPIRLTQAQIRAMTKEQRTVCPPHLPACLLACQPLRGSYPWSYPPSCISRAYVCLLCCAPALPA